MGLPLDDPKRLAESVSEVLRKQQEQGSTCADVDTLLEHSRNVSGIRADVLESFLRQAIQNKNQEFVAFETPRGPVAASVTQYNAEAAIAQGLARLLAHGRRNDLQDVRAAADALFARPEFKKFDEIQRCAVMMAASEPISILTGGPGTGKSTVMEAVAKLSDMLDGGPLFLAAPVGKAAKRLSETTKRNASTVHRLLEARMNDDGESYFLLGRGKTLPPRSFVVVDETSMQDAELMAALIEALPPDGRLLLTGDDGQLPSVGAGAVLADMLSARVGGRPVIPAVKLEEVYRTDKDSGIAKGAALIREGVVPELTEENCGGVSFRPKAASDIVSEIERIVCEELVKQKIDPMRDVAVLCPQAPGPGGTWEINRRLSTRLNPNGARIPGVEVDDGDDRKMPIPRVGDRVMLTENNKKKEIMNGEVGTITRVGKSAKGRPVFYVRFDTGTDEVEVPAAAWRNYILAYAGTVHKSQGSQYRVVIMPFVKAHEKMLDRAIVYTGWTRAQERLIALGDKGAFEQGIRTSRKDARMTLLLGFLEGFNPNLIHRAGYPDWQALASRAKADLTKRLGRDVKPAAPPAPTLVPSMFGVRRKPTPTPVVAMDNKPTAPSVPTTPVAAGRPFGMSRGLAKAFGSKASAPAQTVVPAQAPAQAPSAPPPPAPTAMRRPFGMGGSRSSTPAPSTTPIPSLPKAQDPVQSPQAPASTPVRFGRAGGMFRPVAPTAGARPAPAPNPAPTPVTSPGVQPEPVAPAAIRPVVARPGVSGRPGLFKQIGVPRKTSENAPSNPRLR